MRNNTLRSLMKIVESCPEAILLGFLYISIEIFLAVIIGGDSGGMLIVGFHFIIAPIMAAMVLISVIIRAFVKRRMILIAWATIPIMIIYAAWKAIIFLPLRVR